MSNAWWTVEGYIAFKESTTEERITEVMNALQRSKYKFHRENPADAVYTIDQQRTLDYDTILGILKPYKDDIDDLLITETVTTYGENDIRMESLEDD